MKDRSRDVSEKRKGLLKRLGLRIKGEVEPAYEDRIFRAIVYTEYFSIRDLFAEHVELVPIMVDQMIDCTHLVPSDFHVTSLTGVSFRSPRSAIQSKDLAS